MKANELMIGDWVLRFGETPARVDAIGNIEVYLSDDKTGDWTVSYEHIKPIPITSEILEKNGFTHCDYEGSELLDAFCWVEFNEARNGFMINRASIKVTLYKKPIMGVSVLTEIDTYSTKGDGVNKVHSCDIESVHELQHALRLCGIEKEIVL